MKSYKQFVTESNQSREISESWKSVLKVLVGGRRGGDATRYLNAAGLVHAGIRGYESVMNRDKFGAYNAAAMAVPMTNPYSTALKLGAVGVTG